MVLSSDTAKHIIQVLRMQVGDEFEITNGNGDKAVAEIMAFTKRDCTVNVKEIVHVEQHNPDISLGISFTKNSARIEWLLEKITELGIRHIYPMLTERTVKKSGKLERFQKKILSAMLQSQQYYLPTLHQPIPFNQLIAMDFEQRYIAHCIPEISRQALQQKKMAVNQRSLILIGPEGDFTETEVANALQQNFMSVHLGNNRLRTETAGLVAVTLLRYA